MTITASSLRNEIDDLSQRRNLLKQKWIEKQRNISRLLESAVVICRTSADDIHPIEQQQNQESLLSDTSDELEFENLLVDYINKHASVSITTLAEVFFKKEEQIISILKKLKFNVDTETKTVLHINTIDQSSISNISKSSSSQTKRSLPSWMGLPLGRGALIPRERPSRQLVHLLSHLTVRESEREKLNADMDWLVNQQTSMEKMLSRRFRTNDTIQEYCQYTTRDECPLANSHSRLRSRSSSRSSDTDHPITDDDFQAKKKRKRDESMDLNDQAKYSSRYYKKSGRNVNTCGKVHFRRLIKPHTDRQLGDCSFLNTCFHMVRRI